ncbi:hypothetical protein EOK75_06770 [Pseudorhodobacter turbinis]|uniref:Uncharacterized protein n=1 Tax=Pseudorhodobacter turbinis TaxID=2500533 RepID=A0A4P8EFK2_9RHOB|nr:hypothetical protein [Pseudorhodobacter turbinis]QCO55482.1 hypothetical protein EOK75_06770 [Pseudorhodobacter turbinis]
MRLFQKVSNSYSYLRNWRVLQARPVLLIALVLPVQAWSADVSDLPAPLQKIVNEAAQTCAEFDNGEFALDWGSVQRADLDGDLQSDWILNDSGFSCSNAASLYCGTGGCMSHFLIGENLNSLLNQGWEVVTFGPHRVLLADVHGSDCGGINPTPCTVASIWDPEERVWRSTTANW